MSKQCQHIKANGQQCRGSAIWGIQPPRCPAHRLDGGPRPSYFEAGNQLARLTLKHGFFSRRHGGSLAPEDKVARCLLTHERLSALLKCQDDQRRLLHYFRLFGQNLARLLRLLAEYEQTTGQHPDRLLEKAAGEPLATLLARLNAVRHTAHQRSHRGSGRSPRYWLVYQAIVDHIRTHHISPTLGQLKKACGINSNLNLGYWLNQLEQDGLIIRRPGPRGIYLPPDPQPP